MEIKVVTENVENTALHLHESGEHALHTRSTMEKIFFDMLRVEREIFHSQGRRGGGNWRRLQPQTIKRKGGYLGILIDNGFLMESVSVPGALYQIANVSNNSVSFGTDRPGAASHQFGSNRKNIPARPFIRFTSRDLVRWEEWVADSIAEPFNRA